jgi:hypothetical protein
MIEDRFAEEQQKIERPALPILVSSAALDRRMVFAEQRRGGDVPIRSIPMHSGPAGLKATRDRKKLACSLGRAASFERHLRCRGMSQNDISITVSMVYMNIWRSYIAFKFGWTDRGRNILGPHQLREYTERYLEADVSFCDMHLLQCER